ncbi:AAA family ATPase [Kitasatospora sp. GP82]|uniref:AAA family ATPase n=1 Tax=Kitasatospora sp. GP82 TaxID=3035089 RepID=UPI002475E6C2|nr:AAA family ATPase [Kitasatospora sp. GP82]MDH6125924.1 hypothetical protein [Kitasatospora sp. GP82]
MTQIDDRVTGDPWAGKVPPMRREPERDDAYVSPEEASEEHFEKRLKALEAELLGTEDLDNIPALEPIIADVLFRDTLARIFGASGTFKSFTTLDFAGCVGTGKLWHGRLVRQGLVIYLVAEGIKGIRKRVRAWEQHYGIKMTGVRFLPRPVQAMDPEWLVLIELCQRLQPALVIVDTQARVTVGIEENSNTEMGRVVDRMEQLRTASGACVLLVHHTGNEGERGRGATAVKGALQTEISITRKGKSLHDITVTLGTGKQKDDEELGDVVFGLHQIQLKGEAKEDGTPVTSVVLVALDAAPQRVSSGPEPGSPEWIADQLDKAGVPLWGRDRITRKCAELGIKARKDKIEEAIRIRANRPAEPAPEPAPDLPPLFSEKAAPEGGAGSEEIPGQTCPGQIGGRSGAGALTEPAPSPRPLGRGQVGAPRPNAPSAASPLPPSWPARASTSTSAVDLSAVAPVPLGRDDHPTQPKVMTVPRPAAPEARRGRAHPT